MAKVIIGVKDGMAFLVSKPEDCEIEIRDYDIEGFDIDFIENCPKDEDGDSYEVKEL
jgi:hypothetical protein